MNADQLVAALMATALIPAARVTTDDNTLAPPGARPVSARTRPVLIGTSPGVAKLVPTAI